MSKLDKLKIDKLKSQIYKFDKFESSSSLVKDIRKNKTAMTSWVDPEFDPEFDLAQVIQICEICLESREFQNRLSSLVPRISFVGEGKHVKLQTT